MVPDSGTRARGQEGEHADIDRILSTSRWYALLSAILVCSADVRAFRDNLLLVSGVVDLNSRPVPLG